MQNQTKYTELSKLRKLPNNPRFIRDNQFATLVKSIQDNPDYFEARPIICSNRTGELVIIAGNQRYEAAKSIKIKEVPVYLMEGLTEERERELVIRDNISNGEWDMDILANLWSDLPLTEWGIDVPNIDLTPIDELEAEEDDFEEPEDMNTVQTNIKTGDILEFRKGALCHRLLCGSTTEAADMDKLMNGRKADLVTTDPPYNVDYKGGTKDALKIANDNMSDDKFLRFLVDSYTQLNGAMKPGAAFYIWHADSEGYNFRTAAKQVGWKIRQCLIWVKNSLVMGRQDYQWKHEPCQPAGTMVRTPNGEVPIESLKNGDLVVSYDKYAGTIKGMRDGLKVKVAKRDYDGEIYTVKVGERETKTTDTHQFTIRFRETARTVYCTYLMRKGNWWRVGLTETYNSRGFGLKTRFRQEGAEEAWIIGTYDNRMEAQCAEQLLAIKYGIPLTHWSTDRGILNFVRTDKMIHWIYENMDLAEMEVNACRLLKAFGRRRDYPIIDNTSATKRFSCRVTARIAACNLIPEIMDVPIPYSKWDTENDKTFDWEQITSITRDAFSGPVYSLEVDKYEHYIADGIVTHNCLYGWKDGAGHFFVDDRTNTTVYEDKIDVRKLTKPELVEMLETILSDKTSTSIIHEDKPSRNAEHPTMKPVRLIARGIKNSSKIGQTVMDGFAGSGTSGVACHQLGRNSYMMEMDERYCQVIWDRMVKLDSDIEVFINDEQVF